MQDDNKKIIELLAESLHEQREMRLEMRGMHSEMQGMRLEINEMRGDIQQLQQSVRELREDFRDEQRSTRNAIWELTQLLEKVALEPITRQGMEISELKQRVSVLEQSRKAA